MCGIVGFCGLNDLDLLTRMNNTQTYRGPDDSGYFSDDADQVNFAMRRLSILDIQGGHQPMSNNEKDTWIVFNGEIFNAPELRNLLESIGYVFKTDHSDTEVLIHLYNHYKEKMAGMLNGMFAFVIYDKKEKKIFGARDRFGIKPLYYSLSNGKFAFASELKSLMICPWLGKDINYQSLYHFFSFQAIPCPGTIFKDANKLPPANYFSYSLANRTFTTNLYWTPNFSKHDETFNIAECEEKIRHEFIEAVNRWTLSDVETACSLSGGIDSSAIVGAMCQSNPKKIKTFTLGFNDADDMDERALARTVANLWNTDHHEIIISEDNLLDEIDTMIWHLDEPYAGGLPSWFVYKEMSKSVKVVFTGTGGDELFGNYGKWKFYNNYRDHLYVIRKYIKEGGSLQDWFKWKNGALHYPYFTDGFKIKNIFNPTVTAGLKTSASFVQNLWDGASKDKRNAVAKVDLSIQLPEEFLLMTDRFSMAHSVEARTPFLDSQFADYVLSIPSEIRSRPDSLKYLFIGAIGNLLPPELITAPKKGFTLPINRWMKTSLRPRINYYFDKKYMIEQGIFNPSIVESIVEPFLNSKQQEAWPLWTLLMFQMWHDKFINRN